MRALITFMLLFSIPCLAASKQGRVGVIYNHVLKNKPKMAKAEARLLAGYIYESSIVHKIDPILYSAMLMQESKYNVAAISYKTQFNKKTGKIEKIGQDFGIAQINYKTIEAYKFDKKRLVTDLQYSVEAGAIVLRDFKRAFALTDEEWWTRYNARTLEKREIYQALVTRYM